MDHREHRGPRGRGAVDEALAAAERARASDAYSPAFETASSGFLSLIPVHIHRGELDRARALMDSSTQMASSENLEVRIGYETARVQVLRAEGRSGEVPGSPEEILSLLPQYGLTNVVMKVSVIQVIEAALDGRDISKAEALLGIVQRAMPGEVTPFLRAHGARLSARLTDLRGETDSVDAGFAASEQGFRDLGTPFDLALALVERGEWLVAHERRADAEPLLIEARAIFEKLRAAPWLERVERAVSAPTASTVTEAV